MRWVKSRFIFSVACALMLVGLSGARADEAKYVLPVGTSYKDFATADVAATMSSQAFKERQGNLSDYLPEDYDKDTRLHREIENGYLTLWAESQQTTLRVPLGWSAVFAKDESEILIISPDERAKIIVRLEPDADAFETTFDNPKRLDAEEIEKIKRSRKLLYRVTEWRLKKLGLELHEMSRGVWQNGDFQVDATDATDEGGRLFSYVERITRRGTPSERAFYRKKPKKEETIDSLPVPLSLALLTPADEFEKYLPLFEMILRDAGLKWGRTRIYPPKEFAEKVPESARFLALEMEAIAIARTGDDVAFQARFPNSFAEAEPFFKELPKTPTRTEISVSRDRDPVEPFLQIDIVRHFKVGKKFMAYDIKMELNNDKVELLGIFTTDDPDLF